MHNPRRARALAVCTGVSVAHRSRARIVPARAADVRWRLMSTSDSELPGVRLRPRHWAADVRWRFR